MVTQSDEIVDWLRFLSDNPALSEQEQFQLRYTAKYIEKLTSTLLVYEKAARTDVADGQFET
jgi:hypothetical protein